jgi:N4-gp56 family major capsid protein
VANETPWTGTATGISATPSVAGTNGGSFVPKIWLDEMLVAREKNLIAGAFFRRINHKGKKGDTLHIPYLSNLVAHTKVTNVGVVLNQNQESETTVVIDQHKEVSQLFEDFLMVQSMYNLRQEYTAKMGYALSLELDSALMALFAPTCTGLLATDGTTYAANVAKLAAGYVNIGGDGSTPYSDLGSGNASALTDAGFRHAQRILNDNNVPRENRVLFIPPVAEESLLGIDKFVLANYVGRTKELWNADFGSLYGVQVKTTTNCPTIKSADGTIMRVAVLAHKDAVCSAVQQDIRVQAQYKQEMLGTLLTADMIYGVKALRVGNAENVTTRISHAVALVIPS